MASRNLLLGKMVSRGYTQLKLAEAIGVSKNTINTKINGKRPFDTDEIQKICDVLGITNSSEAAEIFLSSTSQYRDSGEQESA